MISIVLYILQAATEATIAAIERKSGAAADAELSLLREQLNAVLVRLPVLAVRLDAAEHAELDTAVPPRGEP